MKSVAIFRNPSTDEGTFGRLITSDFGFNCFSLELPWRDNKPNISCIPVGIYLCKMVLSGMYGYVYTVVNVKGRSYIRIHWGNLAGDEQKKYRSHSEGCILLGDRVGRLYDQKAVLLSKITVFKFMDYMNREPFKLHIIGE